MSQLRIQLTSPLKLQVRFSPMDKCAPCHFMPERLSVTNYRLDGLFLETVIPTTNIMDITETLLTMAAMLK